MGFQCLGSEVVSELKAVYFLLFQVQQGLCYAIRGV